MFKKFLTISLLVLFAAATFGEISYVYANQNANAPITSPITSPVPTKVTLYLITPNIGQIGGVFTIYGTGFSQTALYDKVFVGKVLIPTQNIRVAADGKSLSFNLPIGSSLQPKKLYPVYIVKTCGPNCTNVVVSNVLGLYLK